MGFLRVFFSFRHICLLALDFFSLCINHVWVIRTERIIITATAIAGEGH